jgi:hypothetical protein
MVVYVGSSFLLSIVTGQEGNQQADLVYSCSIDNDLLQAGHSLVLHMGAKPWEAIVAAVAASFLGSVNVATASGLE